MKTINLIKANIKLLLADKINFAILILLPIIIVAGSVFASTVLFPTKDKETSEDTPSENAIHFIDGEKPTGKALELSNKIGLVTTNKDFIKRDFDSLKKGKLAAIFEIGPDFNETLAKGERPLIKIYKLGDSSSLMKAMQNINDFFKENLSKQVLDKYPNLPQDFKDSKNFIKVETISKTGNTDLNQLMLITFLMYFLSMLITPISKFMMNLKNNRVYERLATTSASGFKIMFTQFISIALIESVVYSLALYGVNKAFNIGLNNIFHILTFMFLFTSINVAIAMLITRVIKNEEMGPSVGMIFAMIQFFLVLSSVLPIANSSVKALTNVLNKFNPMYWTLFGIKNSQLFPNVIMLVLMIGVFVTAGSYKFMKMAKE